MRTKWLVFLVAALAALALWGCGSNGGSGGSDVADSDDPSNLDTVGATNCLVCHERQTLAWGNTLDTPASNGMNERSNAHGNANGRPPLNYFGNDPENCNGCHDPAGDGDSIVDDFGASSNRPVVGCEGCHGGGSAHRGVGPIPYPSPDIERCADCHNAHGNNVNSLEEDYVLTSHATHSHGSSAKCQRCHTHEGALAFGDSATGNKTVMDALADPAQTTADPMICATCHDEHYFGFRIPLNWSFGGDPQFDLCTSCHTLLDPTIGDGWVRENSYHTDRASRTIADTHYDDPSTVGSGDTGVIEGYVVRNDGDNACADCHDVHATNRVVDDGVDYPEDPDNNPIDINRQWAYSAHGGFIGEVKNLAADIFAEGVTNAVASAWVNYNWDDTDSRDSCQECHTATGAMNYLDDPEGYDPAANDFSHLDSWSAVGGSPQQELLYCWGCHSDAGSGSLRNPGAITRPYSVGGAPVTLDDLGNSNVCVNCHGARGNMEEYFPEVMEDPTTDFTGLNAGFGSGTKNVTEAHYLVAAATIYAADTRIGYEYSMPGGALLDYTPVSFYAHDGIALNGDSPETGSGSCAACHMETAEPHLFGVVTKDDSGVITSLNSTVCIECHDGENGPALEVGSAEAAAFLEEEAEGYHETIEILEAALGAVGIVFQDNYPYFDTTIAGSWINEGNFGAAHNYNYLYHEPGAYAHNRIYTKRLLFDSIDWVDNYTLDGTITIDAATYPEAAHWLGADDAGFVSTRP